MSRLKIWDLATGNWQYAGSVDPVALANDPAFRNAVAANASLVAALSAQMIGAGTIWSTAAATPDLGWIFLTGQTIANCDTTYPSLWSRIPAGWKSGTSLLVPDMRGRTIIGAGQGGGLTARTLGTAISNEETHLLAAAECGAPALSTGWQSADHSHSGTSSTVSADHSHALNINSGTESADHAHGPTAGHSYFSTTESGPSNPDVRVAYPGTLSVYASYIGATAGRNAAHTHNVSGNTGGISANHTHTMTTGGVSVNHYHATTAVDASAAHNNMQPSYVLNWQMKVH